MVRSWNSPPPLLRSRRGRVALRPSRAAPSHRAAPAQSADPSPRAGPRRRPLHRTNRQVELTDAGRAFLVEARLTLAQAEHATEVASRAARGEVGQLIIGHMASAGAQRLPPTLASLPEASPGGRARFKLLGASEQFQMLRDGQIHAGFCGFPRAKGPDREMDRPRTARGRATRTSSARSTPLAHVLALRARCLFSRAARAGLLRCTHGDLPPGRRRAEGLHDTNRLHTMLSLVATGRGISLTGKCVGRLARPGVVCRPLGLASQYRDGAGLRSEESLAALARIRRRGRRRLPREAGNRMEEIMKMKRVEHIAIAVDSLRQSINFLRSTFGLTSSPRADRPDAPRHAAGRRRDLSGAARGQGAEVRRHPVDRREGTATSTTRCSSSRSRTSTARSPTQGQGGQAARRDAADRPRRRPHRVPRSGGDGQRPHRAGRATRRSRRPTMTRGGHLMNGG